SIDWSFNPTNPINHAWVFELNRHLWWDDLARQYAINPDLNGRYRDQLLFEMRSWINTSPLMDRPNGMSLSKWNNQPGSRWRTIEAGIRARDSWPTGFYTLKN
ncbi:MAG: heparinase II/III family protein, partial [bacterium]